MGDSLSAGSTVFKWHDIESWFEVLESWKYCIQVAGSTGSTVFKAILDKFFVLEF